MEQQTARSTNLRARTLLRSPSTTYSRRGSNNPGKSGKRGHPSKGPRSRESTPSGQKIRFSRLGQNLEKGSSLLLTFVKLFDDLLDSPINLVGVECETLRRRYCQLIWKISCQKRLTRWRSGYIRSLLVCVQCVQITKEGNYEHSHRSLVRGNSF